MNKQILNPVMFLLLSTPLYHGNALALAPPQLDNTFIVGQQVTRNAKPIYGKSLVSSPFREFFKQGQWTSKPYLPLTPEFRNSHQGNGDYTYQKQGPQKATLTYRVNKKPFLVVDFNFTGEKDGTCSGRFLDYPDALVSCRFRLIPLKQMGAAKAAKTQSASTKTST